VNRRTIHRRLEKAGTTYLAVLTEVRSEMVGQYVPNGARPLGAVAELLGFATESAFSE
jgi:AraC-like DNA-binding protein